MKQTWQHPQCPSEEELDERERDVQTQRLWAWKIHGILQIHEHGVELYEGKFFKKQREEEEHFMAEAFGVVKTTEAMERHTIQNRVILMDCNLLPAWTDASSETNSIREIQSSSVPCKEGVSRETDHQNQR